MKKYLEEMRKSQSLAELKKIYKKYVMILHPDLNPGKDTTAEMQELNNVYEKIFASLKDSELGKQAKDREKFNFDEVPKDFINLMYKLIKFKNIDIDIIGNWIWISGDTYKIKEELKSLGFNWSKKRRKWYYSGSSQSLHYKQSNKSYEEIKSVYGCTSFTTNKNRALVGV